MFSTTIILLASRILDGKMTMDEVPRMLRADVEKIVKESKGED